MKSKIILVVFALCLVLTSWGQEHVSFYGIQLGVSQKEFIKKAESKGYKIVAEEDEESYWGTVHNVFMKGEMDSNPAELRIESGKKTRVVDAAEMILRQFIDVEEACDEGDRLIADIKAQVPYCVITSRQNTIAEMIEMLDDTGRIVEYMCIPEAEVFITLYGDANHTEDEDAYGRVTLGIYYNTLDREHIIDMGFFDFTAGR